MANLKIQFFDGFTSEVTPVSDLAVEAPPLAKYSLSTGSALTFTGTYYTCPFDTSDIQDTGYSNSSGVVTVTEAGRYRINAEIVINNTTNVLERIDGYIQIYKNGTTEIYSAPISSYINISDGDRFPCSNVFELVANDTIEIRFKIDDYWGSSFNPEFDTSSYLIMAREQGVKGDTGSAVSVNTKTASFTAVDGETYLVDTTSGAVSVTLPSPALNTAIWIKDTGNAATNNITLLRSASESIEGVASDKVLSTAYGSYKIISDGTDWYLL